MTTVLPTAKAAALAPAARSMLATAAMSPLTPSSIESIRSSSKPTTSASATSSARLCGCWPAPLAVVGARRLTQVYRSPYVGVNVAIRRFVRVGNGYEGGKMKDNVDSGSDFSAKVRIAYVSADNLDLIAGLDRLQPPPIVKGIV